MGGARFERATSCSQGASNCCGLLPPVAHAVERQRFFLTVMMTGLLVVVAPALSVTRAVSV
jgi:hypothetical protein